MLTGRQRIFIASSVIIGLTAAMVLFYIFMWRDSSNKDQSAGDAETAARGGATATSTPAAGVPPEKELKPLSAAEQETLYLKQLARIFVERFSTYSNENNNQQITDVMDMVTARMAAWVETQTVSPAEEFYGVTSQVIASRVVAQTGNEAVVAVDTHRIIENGAETTTENKSGTVNLAKVDGEWKVSGFFWD